eukprot:7964269-Alexandrium_andersonii.AAC.1
MATGLRWPSSWRCYSGWRSSDAEGTQPRGAQRFVCPRARCAVDPVNTEEGGKLDGPDGPPQLRAPGGSPGPAPRTWRGRGLGPLRGARGRYVDPH